MPPSPDVGAVLYAADFARLSAFYSRLLGLAEVEAEDDYVILRSATFELVILTTAQSRAIAADASQPAVPRTDAAIKPVFHVADLAVARETANSLGGGVHAAAREWRFQDSTVCDGHDPEGNVFQLRQRDA